MTLGVADPPIVPVASNGAPIDVRGISKSFKDPNGELVWALKDIDLSITEGEFLVLLGASGCGKTTMLRCLAGLESADTGEILIGDPEAAKQRRTPQATVGMVFQSYALWPHMTVRQNVAYPLTTGPRRERPSRAEVRQRVDDMLELMNLGGMGDRKIHQLSGGQQQRVALARAIAPGSKVVLFDEPLSNIDAQVREQLRRDLRAMQRELGFTAVYVTHDQAEAFELADRIAVMNDGKVVQIGAGIDLYERPADRFVAEFIGSANVESGTIAVIQDGVATVETSYGPVEGTISGPVTTGDRAAIISRPHRWQIAVAETGQRTTNAWHGNLEVTTHFGWYDEHIVRLGDTSIRIWTDKRTDLEAAVGGQVSVSIDVDDCRVMS